MDIVKDVILQLCIIIFPIYVYQILWFDKFPTEVPKPNRLFICFFSSLAVICCMTFPISISTGSLYDLRAIPLVVAILYGGYLAGIITALVVVLYSLFLGAEGFLEYLVAYPLYAFIPYLICSKWYTYSKKTRHFYALIIVIIKSFSSTVSYVVILYIKEDLEFFAALRSFDALFYTTLVQIICFAIVIFLCEYTREVALIRSQVLQAEKLNVVSQLAASVAHEIRNPLTVVRGFIQFLNDHKEDQKQGYIKLVLSELDRAELIISDYLNLAKPQLKAIEKVNIGSLLCEVKMIITPYATIRGTEIELQTEDELWVLADQAQLKQVFMNIIKNAIESISKDGHVWINASLKKDEIIIKVKDTGVGMSTEQLKKIGQPFHSTKEKGTGLGLVVTYRLIYELKGHIRYTSEVGKGTEVTVTLPFAGKG